MARRVSRIGSPLIWVELFVLANLAFLALDVFVAHSTNDFAHPAEWIPFAFSLLAPVVLGVELSGSWRRDHSAPPAGRAGWLVGWASLAVGIGGLVLHLESRFFADLTLRSLVYTAPFVAPLAYAGLGFLLLLDRMVDPRSEEWSRWVLLLALGGFVGNFVLSLADHAQNGFFVAAEWIPVVASAFAIGFLPVAAVQGGGLGRLGTGVLASQIGIGLLGFGYHLAASLRGPSTSPWQNLIYGAPVFAPLLFPNLTILAGIALWARLDNPSPARLPRVRYQQR